PTWSSVRFCLRPRRPTTRSWVEPVLARGASQATEYVWSSRFLRRWVAAGYEAIMRYVRLAGTDLDVSTVALGCGNCGGIGSVPELFGRGEDEAAAFALMDAAREH